MYNFGYGRGNQIFGTDDNCAACAGGRIGCAWDTYHNNELYGSPSRTVKFIKVIRDCVCGEEIDILVPDMEFFDRFRYDCRKCANFVAEICACIEFGDTRKVFIADGPGCKRLIPLETAKNGFLIRADQLQPFSNGHCKLIMTTCYDCKNDHVTISNYYRSHAKCDCRKCGCECDCKDGFDGFDGRGDFDKFDGMKDGFIG